MPRPVKWRRVEFIPHIRYFVPAGVPADELGENVLKVEELEAIRLKDVEGLEQEECAKKMGISRQTFQRILNSARRKVASSLVNGKAIRIEGGNFTRNICRVRCLNCDKEWEESYENYRKAFRGEYGCPYCASVNIVCIRNGRNGFCRGHCWRNGRR